MNAIVTGVVTGSIVALGAIGLALVYSIASVPNFAHGELLTLGAYVAFLVNQPDTVPVFHRLADAGAHTSVTSFVVFLVTMASYLTVVYLVGGRSALEGRWMDDRRKGVAANLVVAATAGAVVVGWSPSLWAAAVFAAVVLAVAAPVVDRVVFEKFREEGAGLATMLIVALGVSFVLRFGLQAYYGARTRRFDVPDTVGVLGWRTDFAAAKFIDIYASSSGLVVEVTDTATDATVTVSTWSWFTVAAVAGSVAVAGLLGYVAADRWLQGWRRFTAASTAASASVLSTLALAQVGTIPEGYIWATRVRISALRLLIVVVAAAMMICLHVVLHRTKLGKAMRASSDNLDLAKVSGIDTRRVMTLTWVIAGVFAGTGGVLLGARVGTIGVSMGFDLLIPMFAAVILGGVGSVYGAILGSYVVGLSMDAGVYVVPGIGPEYRVPMAFAVLLLVLLVKPEGLKG